MMCLRCIHRTPTHRWFLYLSALCGAVIFIVLLIYPISLKDVLDTRDVISTALWGYSYITVTCPLARRPPHLHNNRWHLYDVIGQDGAFISVYGAYYDTRSQHQPWIRIFGVTSAPDDRKLYCQLWHNVSDIPRLSVVKHRQVIGRGAKVQGIQYKENIFSCKVRLNTYPERVSLVFNKCDNSTISLPVVYANNQGVPSYQHDFGMCIAASFGDLDTNHLIEWIEFHRILGVTEINIYNSNLSQPALNVFKHYEKLGIVKLDEAPPPVYRRTYWSQKLAVIPSLNDCMYRNMYNYKYIISVDFDEIIMPKIHMNYLDLISAIQKDFPNDPKHFYFFENIYFFTDLPNNATAYSSDLFTMKYTSRLMPSKPGYSVKSITNPRKCLVLNNHYCKDHYSWKYGVNPMISVHTKYGGLQHYKPCHFKREKCTKMMAKYFTDTSSWRFFKKLQNNLRYSKYNTSFS